MIGAIIGDIIGSPFEFNNYRAKDFDFFAPGCYVTDDSIMTIAIGGGLLACKEKGLLAFDKYHQLTWKQEEEIAEIVVKFMKMIGRPYDDCGYGSHFYQWMYSDDEIGYNSCGNGSAMRISSVGEMANDIGEVKVLSRIVTMVSHNHIEGLKGAEATAVAVFMAKHGASMDDIERVINDEYYPIGFTIDKLRETYKFDGTCQGTVPQALQCFFESTDYVDCIRNCISIGGDSDTIAAIAGGVAAAYYGVPSELKEATEACLDERLRKIYDEFERRYPTKVV